MGAAAGLLPESQTIHNQRLGAMTNPSSQAGIVGAAPVKVVPHWFLFNPKGDSLPDSSYFFWSTLLLSSNCVFKYISTWERFHRVRERMKSKGK